MALLLSPATGLPQTQRTITVNLTAIDHYSERPLQSASAILYYRGHEVQSAQTDAQGNALFVHTITGLDQILGPGRGLRAGQNYPNPFEQQSSLTLFAEVPQNVYASLVNLLGGQLASAQFDLEPGTYTLKLRLDHLHPGIYFLNIRGVESRTIRLIKTGGGGGHAGQALSLLPMSDTPAAFPDGPEGPDGEKQTHPDYSIAVSKERYTTKTLNTWLTQDTTMLFPMKRNNLVAFASAGEDGNPMQTEIVVSGAYFRQEITTPDTLLMQSGQYTVTSAMPFIKPIEKSIEVQDYDMVVQLEVEKVESMVYEHNDPESDILSVADHEEGFSGFFHGLKETAGKIEGASDVEYEGMHLTHVILRYPDASSAIVVFNEELFPILWVTDHFVISVRRAAGQAFDPRIARISIVADSPASKDLTAISPGGWYNPGEGHTPQDGGGGFAGITEKTAKQREDTLTLDISVGNLHTLLGWIEQEAGRTFELAREFLNAHGTDWEAFRQQAMTAGEYQDDFIRAAAAFSILASAKAITGARPEMFGKGGPNPGHFLPAGVIPSPLPSTSPPSPAGVGAGVVGCAFRAWYQRSRTDRSGFTVPIYVCRGATSWSGVCQNAVFTGTVSRCLSRCPVNMDCFIDICAPDVMNIQRVLAVRQNH